MSSGHGLVLIGARGSGKTTLGRALASRLRVDFVDTDELVEARAGCTIADLFALRGETAFRQLEQEALTSLDPRHRQIVASGGGAVLEQANRERLVSLGPIAWLTASTATLAARIAGSDRPSLTGIAPEQELAGILEERKQLYADLATWVVETEGRSPLEICDELEQLWRLAQDHDLR